MIDLNRQHLTNRPYSGHEGAINPEFLKWFGLFATIALFAVSSVYIRNQILAVQYEIQQIARENEKIAEQNNLLRAEFKSLVNPQQIEAEARRLGMINSNQPGILVLEGDQFGRAARTYAHSQPVPKVVHE